jgi:hypothetical protein
LGAFESLVQQKQQELEIMAVAASAMSVRVRIMMVVFFCWLRTGGKCQTLGAWYVGLGGASTDLLAQQESRALVAKTKVSTVARRFMRAMIPKRVRKKLANPWGSARQKSEVEKNSSWRGGGDF